MSNFLETGTKTYSVELLESASHLVEKIIIKTSRWAPDPEKLINPQGHVPVWTGVDHDIFVNGITARKGQSTFQFWIFSSIYRKNWTIVVGIDLVDCIDLEHFLDGDGKSALSLLLYCEWYKSSPKL